MIQELPQQSKIRLEESPYTYVRTTVMRTLLIHRSEYKKLLKMSLSEISHYLGNTQYRKEINELGVRFSGIELIEHALNKNFIHTIEKLKRISPDSYNSVIESYLLKYDIDNIKTIFRGKKADLSEEEIKELLLPVGLISMKKLELLMKKTPQEIMKSLPSPLDRFLAENKKLKADDLTEVETKLDHFYFKTLLKFSERLPKQGILFKEFLLTIIHITNLLTFLRLRKEKVENIAAYIFFTESEIENVLFKQLLKAKTDDDILKLLKRSLYRDVLDTKTLFQESLIPVEISLQNYLYKKTIIFQHQDPLSVYVILGFMFAKEMEIKNLKKIIKAKHLGIDMEIIEQQLVA
ncbi:MAG: V-type ATPase subunit [Candidatus Woesearchaeota archaeon]